MPEIKQALILESAPAGPGYHALLADAETDLGALPGQWAAFHTDLPNAQKPGDVLRRAWSFAELSGPRRFRLFVAVVGPCTRWLAASAPGERLRFTGPWGSRFRLDEDPGPATFFAVGSGISPIGAMVDAAISPIGAMVDAALAAGRACRLLWERPTPMLEEKLGAWEAAGAQVQVGARLEPRPDGARWWLAGDGPRIDEVLTIIDAPPERVERFYTPRGAA